MPGSGHRRRKQVRVHTPPTPGNTTDEPDIARSDIATPAPAAGKRPGRLRRLIARRSTRVVLALLAVFAGWLSWSVGNALAAPGDDSVAARLAEWGRDHELGPVVTELESLQYQAHPPAVGGRPDIALVPTGAAAPGASTGKAALPAVVPPRLASPAGPPLPGEGTWQVLGSVRGTPALYGAYVLSLIHI